MSDHRQKGVLVTQISYPFCPLRKSQKNLGSKSKFILMKFCVWCICSIQFSSIVQSCPTLCYPMNRSTPGLPVRNITLPTKIHLVKAMVFPVVMYGCESWTVKKAEHWRTDAFELRCWRRLLRVPLTAKRYNQSILKEINPGISLEGMMLKLKLQYFRATSCKELTHWKRLWCWEGLGAGGEGDNGGWDGWMASLTRWTWVWVNSGEWCIC